MSAPGTPTRTTARGGGHGAGGRRAREDSPPRSGPPPEAPGRGRWIEHWDVESPSFWNTTGRRTARRNLIWSIAAEHLGFVIWTLWSVLAVELSDRHLSADRLFWLVALPHLVGAVLRVPYTFAPARFGGRDWTVTATLLLLVPAVLLGIALDDPATPYGTLLLIAATAGLGGGNFASSMANITHFYPASHQGLALGLNAAGGNIGVSSVQLLVPLVVTALGLAAAGFLWVPLILLVALGAHRYMDNLRPVSPTVGGLRGAARNPHTWLVSLLYIGTFGSFVGFATALPLLVKVEFPQSAQAWYVHLGALVGSCARPLGGLLADRLGGARVTTWNFLAMAGAALGALAALRAHHHLSFLLAFGLLFLTAGIGNGSTYRMIPAILRARALRGVPTDDVAARSAALDTGRREAAAVLGVTSAAGALGGFLINRALGASLADTGDSGAALLAFAAFYGLCLLLTWSCYLRRAFATGRAPSLAGAGV
ncbi:nitrate/nitrite transporter [Streptomyces sp. NPDC048606]|uniref:nitrate/nitrite transporter n=1 Tax=Streptomyces sp. NPDC048606 TaxID=3154726 RepID=UPI00341F8F4C